MNLRGLGPVLRRFAGNRQGNVATILAVSMVPLVLLVGASVDYTRAVTQRTNLQQATDATALAIAHYLTQNLTQAQLTTNTQNYFSAAVADTNASITSGPTVSPDNTQVCIITRTTVNTTIMRAAAVLGPGSLQQVTVKANSCAKINNTTYEIALALDNSGSMNESTSGTTKMASLQTAAQQLVAVMDPAGQTPKASISVVPFNSTVNVGSGYANASWMDTRGQSSIHWQNFQMPLASKYNAWVPTSKFDFFTNFGSSGKWSGCVEERPSPYMVTDTPADSTNPDTLFVPYLWPDEGTSSINTYKNFAPINNYLSDTQGICSSNSVYTSADTPGSSVSVTNVVANTLRSDGQTKVCKYKNQSVQSANSLFQDVNGNMLKAGPNLFCINQPITTLNNDTTVLNSAISTMSPNGDTNLIGGLMWAWRTISPNGPFGTQPATPVGKQNPQPYVTNNNVKVIILMTDGYNHWADYNSTTSGTNGSVYSSLGYYANARLGTTDANSYRGAMDTATQQACTNAKAAGIQIYTVGLSIPSNPIDTQGQTLLQNCASDLSMSYIKQDGSGLIAAFKSISASMSGLRLVN